MENNKNDNTIDFLKEQANKIFERDQYIQDLTKHNKNAKEVSQEIIERKKLLDEQIKSINEAKERIKQDIEQSKQPYQLKTIYILVNKIGRNQGIHVGGAFFDLNRAIDFAPSIIQKNKENNIFLIQADDSVIYPNEFFENSKIIPLYGTFTNTKTNKKEKINKLKGVK